MTADRRMPSDADLRRIDREGVKDLVTGRKRRLPRSHIARLYGISPQRLRRVLGPLNRRRRGFEVTVRVNATTPSKVRAVALRHGCIVSAGAHSGKGSINDLLDAIAQGTLRVRRRSNRCMPAPQPTASLTVRLPSDAPSALRRIASRLDIAPTDDGSRYLVALLDGIASGALGIEK
jgi:hypothetical protein